MWKISKRYGCQPTQISKPSRLRRRERNAMARDAINVGNTIGEPVNVGEINHVPVEETEHAENTDQLRLLLPLELKKLMRLAN